MFKSKKRINLIPFCNVSRIAHSYNVFQYELHVQMYAAPDFFSNSLDNLLFLIQNID